MASESVDVVILTYKPDKRFSVILKRLGAQTVSISRIIVMDTTDDQAEPLTAACGGEDFRGEIEIHPVSKNEFNHGRTRNEGAAFSDADYLIFMTQDAVPADRKLVEKLLLAAKEEKTAISYARQLPNRDCGIIERYNRSFNYPEGDLIKSREDIPEYGIKTFFCSNVCACYDRRIFDRLGGFADKTIFNEDMIYAAKAVKAGYRIHYVSGARVYHSHDYGIREQFHRNFDLGVSQAEHPEVFASLSSEKEGKKLVTGCIRYLIRKRRLYLLPDFILKCAARYLGYRMGLRYRSLPKKIVMMASTDPDYFFTD